MSPGEWLILGSSLVGMLVVGYQLLESTRPVYRDGCGECGTAQRREVERQQELAHDYVHRGIKAPGFPAPTQDRWPCSDPACPRNPPLFRR
jgi:hypothetical protein